METIKNLYILLFQKRCIKKMISSFFLTFILTFQSTTYFSQTVLQFNNGGTNGAYIGGGSGAGTVGAIYQWPNVGSENGITIKAKIEILSITGGATLTTIDGTTNTSDWEPQITGPSTTSGNSWSMKFKISFYDASNNTPYNLTSFVLQGIDIDGGGSGSPIREFNTFSDFNSYTLESPSQLTVNSTVDGTQFLSPQTSFSGISTANTTVITSCEYSNKNSVNVICGVKCVGGTCSGNRLHSLNFRNVVTFTSPITLPLELVSFNAELLHNNEVKINWVTASETNSHYFTVEKWKENSDFENVFTIDGAGNSSSKIEYSFTDELNSFDIYYYRLKEVDLNGKMNYSDIVTVDNRIKERELLSMTNSFGQIIQNDYDGLVILHFKDGTTSKYIQHH